MRVWKDKQVYVHPACQFVTFQTSAGKRSRLKLITKGIQCRPWMGHDGQTHSCKLTPSGDFMFILNVRHKKGVRPRRQMNPLFEASYREVFPMMEDGADLLKIAAICGFTPLGPVQKLLLK